jgi:2-polyprenyl-3-methyl-5-hydroxy-6-metoxy-1,4-benzoquinol methylase
MKSQQKYFPKYDELNWFEKFFLNTCCYYPPKPRRVRGLEIEIDLEKYEKTFINAYGLSNVNDFENKKILDFGCGEGGFSVALANKCPNSKIDGIDLLEGQDEANKIKKERGLTNLNFIIGKSENLESNSYDYAFSHDSFEHFEDPKYILSEMIRLVKPGGNILIKFGPTWASPYGRHIGGTIRKDRPWIHLIIPEKIIMRVHSVYHNREILFEKYKDLEGGLNKMTVTKAMKIISSFKNIEIKEKKIWYIWKGNIFKHIPYINELFSGALYVKISKKE